ncbi:MAG: KEOPS complex subunit Pcc1 [Halodesulfurarchaeum sp.]
MTEREPDGAASRRATVRTTVENPHLVAATIRPDNTAEMDTRVEQTDDGKQVVTTIRRDTSGGLRSTLDDYVVNLQVATTVAQHARAFRGTTNTDTTDTP